jgi:tetratricopeptide (TPR) repeat protein
MNPLVLARWNRRRLSSVGLLVASILFAVFGATGCNKLRARDWLNKGVQAYKNGQFDRAIEDFKEAKDLDPDLLNARLYLATAYASQFIPGAPSEENVRKGQQAINEFQEVLAMDPNNISAIDGIGSILFQMSGTPFTPAKIEESRSYHLKHIQLKPGDPEPYYWVGYIDWTLSYRANTDMRAEYNRSNPKKQVKDDQPLPPKVREEYATKYGSMVDQGIAMLKKAIELRPDYDEAVGMLNLILRRKADMVESPQERADLLKQADALVERSKEIRQKRIEAPAKI